MAPVDGAWSILKAAFQPRAATQRLGAGNTQVVFGQTDNPDVMKVGDLQRNPQQLSHMYYNELLSRIPKLRLFTGQQLTEQTEELPSDLQHMRLPYLSMQPKVDPLASSGNKRTDNLRGLALQAQLHEAIPLLEALGLYDLKPPNLGAVPSDAEGPLKESQVVAGGEQRPIRIHDPEFGVPGEFMPGLHTGRQLTGRKPGREFIIPPHQLEDFGRQVDRMPMDDYTQALRSSYEKFHDHPHGLERLENVLTEQEAANQRMLAHLGL